MEKIEYRVRPVTRYVVTRWHQNHNGPSGVEEKGEFDNAETAYAVGFALAKEEHQRLGWSLADERIQYPHNPAFNRPPMTAEEFEREMAESR